MKSFCRLSRVSKHQANKLYKTKLNMINRKKILQAGLLILFITGLNSSFVTGQSKDVYCYDSAEVAEIGNIILENDMLRDNEKEYLKRDSLFSLKTSLLEEKIISLQRIIDLKDEQLTKIEITAEELSSDSWKWWHYTLAFIGTVTFGFTAGVIYDR